MANLLFSTNFENVTKVGNFNMIADGVNLPASFNLAPTQMDFWIEGLDRNSGITPRSGSRCIGLEHFATGTYYEFEMPMNITALNPSGTEFFVSSWHYLPVGFSVANYRTLCTLLMGQNLNPAITVLLTQSGDTFLATLAHTANGVRTDTNAYVPLPLGSWFQVAYYVKMDTANGEIRVWLNGAEVFTKTGVVTKSDATTYFTYPICLSVSIPVGTTLPVQTFMDDLEVYDGLPSILNPLTASISPASAQISVGQSQTYTAVVTGGAPPYIMQWLVNGVPIAGATGQTYTITPSVEGAYAIALNVRDNEATLVSASATLTVTTQATTGTLQVNAFLDQANVVASVNIAGVGIYNTPISMPLPAGTYTLTATYNGVSQTQTATITVNQTTTVNFQFGGITFPIIPIVIGAGAVVVVLAVATTRKKRKK